MFDRLAGALGVIGVIMIQRNVFQGHVILMSRLNAFCYRICVTVLKILID